MDAARPRHRQRVRLAQGSQSGGSQVVYRHAVDLDELAALDRRYQRQAVKSEALRAERNQAIRELVDDGVRMSAIAHALGVTRPRIAQIYSQPS